MNVAGKVKETGAQALHTVQDATASKIDASVLMATPTTTLPQVHTNQIDTKLKKIKDIIMAKAGKIIPNVTKDVAPKITETIQGGILQGNPKKITDAILGKDTSKVTTIFQDASSKGVMTALRSSDVEAVPQDASKGGAKKVTNFLGAWNPKKVADVISVSNPHGIVGTFQGIALNKAADALDDNKIKKISETIEDTNMHYINDAIKNPSKDVVTKAVEETRATKAPIPVTQFATIQKTRKTSSFDSSFYKTWGVALILLAFSGLYALFAFRHFTKPKPIRIPMLKRDYSNSDLSLE